MPDIAKEHSIETYKSLISISLEAFKFSALANGGAAVALLAYMGNIAGKSIAVPDMRGPMGSFVAGLSFCGFSMVFAYLTQLRLFQETQQTVAKRGAHTPLLAVAITLMTMSVIAFATGALWAVFLFRQS